MHLRFHENFSKTFFMSFLSFSMQIMFHKHLVKRKLREIIILLQIWFHTFFHRNGHPPYVTYICNKVKHGVFHILEDGKDYCFEFIYPFWSSSTMRFHEIFMKLWQVEEKTRQNTRTLKFLPFTNPIKMSSKIS